MYWKKPFNGKEQTTAITTVYQKRILKNDVEEVLFISYFIKLPLTIRAVIRSTTIWKEKLTFAICNTENIILITLHTNSMLLKKFFTYSVNKSSSRQMMISKQEYGISLKRKRLFLYEKFLYKLIEYKEVFYERNFFRSYFASHHLY